jgi:hypothetical protein
VGVKTSITNTFSSSVDAGIKAAKVAEQIYLSNWKTPAVSDDKYTTNQWQTLRHAPPLFTLSEFHESPADSTLTTAHAIDHSLVAAATPNQAARAHREVDVAGTPPSLQVAPRSPAEIYDGVIPAIDDTVITASMEAVPGVGPPLLEDLALDVGINNDVIDDIIFDQQHEEKINDNYVAEDEDVPEQDLEELEHEKYGGGDSDEDGEEANIHNIALARRLIEDINEDKVDGGDDDEREDLLTNSTSERIVLLHGHRVLGGVDIDDDVGEPPSASDEVLDFSRAGLIGAPEGWMPPSCPASFTGYNPRQGDPSEEELDNPAGWSMFTFTPSYHSKTKKYEGHTTPTGARVVPSDATGKRVMNDWEFYYKNWTASPSDLTTYARMGATLGNLKPASRKGCLDVFVLRKHGMTKERMLNDPMFFYQLLFPFCAPSDSGVPDDHRMPFYSNVAVFTNMYAMWRGAGSGYGHDFSPVSIPELVQWAGVPLRNGALDGKSVTLFHRWKENDPRYDSVIAENVKLYRWRQIKRYFKLSMGMEEKKRGEAGYDPCVKYDYIYRCLVHNMNYVTERADLDPALDETSWGFHGYAGDAGWRFTNKPGKTKGDVY